MNFHFLGGKKFGIVIGIALAAGYVIELLWVYFFQDLSLFENAYPIQYILIIGVVITRVLALMYLFNVLSLFTSKYGWGVIASICGCILGFFSKIQHYDFGGALLTASTLSMLAAYGLKRYVDKQENIALKALKFIFVATFCVLLIGKIQHLNLPLFLEHFGRLYLVVLVFFTIKFRRKKIEVDPDFLSDVKEN